MTSAHYFYGLGRRKEAIAKVRLYPNGNGAIVVNGQPMEHYFTRPVDREAILEPFRATENVDKFNATVLVEGGGRTGWAGAIKLGIARALLVVDEGSRAPLRRSGLLTRDARVKERKKYGLKRARKAPQYTKR